MSEETIGEAPEIPEVPKKPRKTLTAILLIAIVAVASVSVFIWWHTQKPLEGEEVPAGYNTYSKYGFTFEYPKAMSVSEQGMLESTATNGSGIFAGELSNAKKEFISIDWLTTSEPSLSGALSVSLTRIKDMGVEDARILVYQGQIVTSAKAEHTMKYQYFRIYTAITGGECFYGIKGAWYCDTNHRLYVLILLYGEKDVLPKFQQYLDSFVCHE